MDLDAALTALARETHDTMNSSDRATGHAIGNRPGDVVGRDMMALVLADAALATLAREAAEATPRPGEALIARVLTDAAGVAAASGATSTITAGAEPARPARRPARAGAAGQRGGLIEILFGWRAGAIAAMGLALALGAGIGFEADPGSLPVLDTTPQDTAPVTLASLETELLDVDGL